MDSSYLLYSAIKCGADIRAYYVRTAFQPQFEFNDAMRVADLLKADVKVIDADILSVPHVAENPDNRCYYCKSAIFETIRRCAVQDGRTKIIDGTNASDDTAERPGMKALNEIGVRSPLLECGLTKAMIRELSKRAGLPTWNKLAYSCLATRIPAGTAVTKELLAKIEGAEEALYQLSFSGFRVRVFGGAARLQFAESEMAEAFERHAEIKHGVGRFFDTVLLDMDGRRKNG